MRYGFILIICNQKIQILQEIFQQLNIDEAYKFVDSQIITFDKMNEAIQNIKTLVNEDKFAKVYS